MKTTMLISCAVLVAAMAGMAGCQGVGNNWEQDATRSVDRTSGSAKTGMVDETGNWTASGPQMSGTTAVDDKGIARTNAGVADSLVFWNGKALGMASNADMTISKSKFYSPDGKGGALLIADIGEIKRDTSTPTRASNEALDRMKAIMKTVTEAQMQVAIKQAEEGNQTARLFLELAAAVASGGTTTAAGAVGAGVDAIAK